MINTPTTEEIRARYSHDWHNNSTSKRDAEYDRRLAEVIRKAKEEAWEEGWGNGNVYGMNRSGGRQENFDNPYRQGETE